METTCSSSALSQDSKVAKAVLRMDSSGSSDRIARISIFSFSETGRFPSAPLRRMRKGA